MKEREKYVHMRPELKESLYYRQIFDKYYKNHSKSLKGYWLPKWVGDIKDPTARILKNY